MIGFTRWRSVSLLLSVGLLAACAAQNCDPDHTDLFTGAGCAMGGGYSARTADFRQQLQYSSAQAAAAHQRAQQAAAEARQAQVDVTTRQSQLKALSQETAALKYRLASAQASRSLSQAQLQKARAELASLQQLQTNPPTDSSVAEIKARQARLNALMSKI